MRILIPVLLVAALIAVVVSRGRALQENAEQQESIKNLSEAFHRAYHDFDSLRNIVHTDSFWRQAHFHSIRDSVVHDTAYNHLIWYRPVDTVLYRNYPVVWPDGTKASHQEELYKGKYR